MWQEGADIMREQQQAGYSHCVTKRCEVMPQLSGGSPLSEQEINPDLLVMGVYDHMGFCR